VPQEQANIKIVLIIIGTFLLFHTGMKGQTNFDSLKIKQPKHYFKTTIFIDQYSKANQKFAKQSAGPKTINDTVIDKKLGSFGLKQFSLGFYTPIYTRTFYNYDSTVNSNTHYLLTGSFVSLQPSFDSIKTHTLIKYGVGLRIIKNTGKKGVWFIDLQPFTTKDVTTSTSNGYFRMANSFIYSHNFSDKLNMRFGITKSFMWGNRYYLPYLGFRYGKLDGFHVSIQIPKNISINFPINDKLRFSIFSKPQGGMYSFLNNDSLYYFHPEVKSFNFTHYEILGGLRLDFILNKSFSGYVDFGSSTKCNITFYSLETSKNHPNVPYKLYFYNKNLSPTGFLNFGLVWRFGKVKSYYNNRNMYDVFDINNANGVGDNNTGPGNTEIPINKKKGVKNSKITLEDMQDLIEVNEL
jgi:hypothetical protein